MATIDVKPDENLKALAYDSLRHAIDDDEAYGQSGDKLVYGNTLGVELIKERDDIRSSQDVLQKEVKALKKEFREFREFKEDKDREVLELYARIKELAAASQGYLNIRHRFLDTFRRDILKDPTFNRTMIQAGNAAAHNGDAVTDACLFENGSRKDKSLLFKVYGLNAEDILSLSRAGYYDSIAVLNARATLKSNKDKPIPQEVEDAWSVFVTILEENLDRPPKDDPNSALGQAYYRFWDAHNKQK